MATKLDFIDLMGEKAREKLCKDAASYSGPILKTAVQKAEPIGPLTSHLNDNEQDKLGTTKMRFSHGLLQMDSPVLADK